MKGMRLVHYYNNKRNNSQKHPEKWLFENFIFLPGSAKCKGSMPDHHTEKNIAKKNGFFKRCNVERKSVTLRNGAMMPFQTWIQSPELNYFSLYIYSTNKEHTTTQ